MTLPILILALPSAIIGWLSKDFFLKTVLPWSAGDADASEGSHGSAEWLPVVASLLALLGIGISWYLYAFKRQKAGFVGNSEPVWFKVIYQKFYIDEVYLFLVKQVCARLIAAPITWAERTLVNGSFDLLTFLIRRIAFIQGLWQSGQVQFYMVTALLGLLLLAWYGGANI
jgi:NADH-quinone oxidoreductase subunit L